MLSSHIFSDNLSNFIEFRAQGLQDNWKFIADQPKSFDKFYENDFKLQYGAKDIKVFYKIQDFTGNGTREVFPKEINSNIKQYSKGFVFKTSNKTLITIFTNKSKLKPEFIECYQRSSLVIGNCQESEFEIRSSLDKYEVLENNLLMIYGASEVHGFKFKFQDISSKITDSISLSYKRINTKFNWLTPLEDITSSVILNASVDGTSVGELIDSLISDLPQRSKWTSDVIAFGLEKKFKLNKVDLVIEPKIMFGNRINYNKTEDDEKININLRAHIARKFGSTEIKFMGNFYTNFLLWEREELYNPRTSKFFKKNFGTLGIELTYVF